MFVHANPNLDSATSLRAEKELQQAALSNGILDDANKNGRETIHTMLGALGFAEVQLR